MKVTLTVPSDYTMLGMTISPPEMHLQSLWNKCDFYGIMFRLLQGLPKIVLTVDVNLIVGTPWVKM